MNLRSYISHLTALGMLTQSTLTTQFLSLYERSRFSGHPISEQDFRTLMALFADILRNLQPLHPSVIQQIRNENNDDDMDSNLNYDNENQGHDAASSNDAASFKSNNTVQHTPHPERYYTPRPERYFLSSGSEAGSEGTVQTAPSQPNLSRRELSRTVSSSKGFRVDAASQSRSSLQSELRAGLRMKKSTSRSLRSQESQGSVIRLAEARTELDLPYTIVAPED
ncbi:MAG: hypothetical protein Q9226_005604 [Calogaya cf. arnoldii]